MSHYRYLSIEEREKLCLTRGLGAKLCEIALGNLGVLCQRSVGN